jgi:hypothetical protein
LETYLYKDLKLASREKDESKIMTLGPYALVLSYILSRADYSKNKEKIFVYRGMRIPKELFREQYGRNLNASNSVGCSDSSIINP